jgi:starvation-inducible outer membrane lipoprotein
MKYLLISFLTFCLIGCASPQFIKFDNQNYANSVIAAQQIKDKWAANSAFVKIAVVGIQEPANAELYTAIVALDTLTAKPDPMTQKDVGETLAWFGRFVAAGTQNVYEKVLPIVLKIIATGG